MSALNFRFCGSKNQEKIAEVRESCFSKVGGSPVKVENDSDKIVVSVAQSICCVFLHTELKISVSDLQIGASKESLVSSPNEKIYDSIEKEAPHLKEVPSEQTIPVSEIQVAVEPSPDTPPQ